MNTNFYTPDFAELNGDDYMDFIREACAVMEEKDGYTPTADDLAEMFQAFELFNESIPVEEPA